MDIIMPQLGETVLEGVITTWYKKPGEAVAADESLFEVETDKVSTDIPSPVPGVVREILVDTGVAVKVGTRLAVIETVSGAAGAVGRESGAAGSAVGPAVVQLSSVGTPARLPSQGVPRRPLGCPRRGFPRWPLGQSGMRPGNCRRWCGDCWPSQASRRTGCRGVGGMGVSPRKTCWPVSVALLRRWRVRIAVRRGRRARRTRIARRRSRRPPRTSITRRRSCGARLRGSSGAAAGSLVRRPRRSSQQDPPCYGGPHGALGCRQPAHVAGRGS